MVSRPSKNNGLRVTGPKSKHKPIKPIKPTRGLVFGPSKRSHEFFESGKRLRMEKVGVGRLGGVVVTGITEKGSSEMTSPNSSTVAGHSSMDASLGANGGDEEMGASII